MVVSVTNTGWNSVPPGHKVAHRRQIGRDRFRIARSQGLAELLEDDWVTAGVEHFFFPTFAQKDSPTRLGR